MNEPAERKSLPAIDLSGLDAEQAIHQLIERAVSLPASDVFLSSNEREGTISVRHLGTLKPLGTLSREEFIQLRDLVLAVPLPRNVARFAVELCGSSRPEDSRSDEYVKDYVSWGAGLRASHYLVLAGKARAVLSGRFGVSVGDIEAVAMPVLRHRIITNFKAEAARIRSEQIIERLLETVPKPSSGL